MRTLRPGGQRVASLACFGAYDITRPDPELIEANGAAQMAMVGKALVSVRWFAGANKAISAHTDQAQKEFYELNLGFPSDRCGIWRSWEKTKTPSEEGVCFKVVRARGLEPPWGCPHTDLNRTRLPIPPRPQVLLRYHQKSVVDNTRLRGPVQEFFSGNV